MHIGKTVIAAAAMVALPMMAWAGERPKANVACKEAGERLVYDCMIMLMGKKSGKPIEGAEIMVKPDMPSMPMAHNVPPVKAMPMGKPGNYHAKLHLEMHGEWALTMDVSGPVRDRLVEKVKFGDMAAEGGHGKMEHGEHGKMKMEKKN
ncbi:MAG: FixH family protein [Alphaproteobacteria bacterium]|nr:FixH family protein [Alphaproteobacteria bacterium]